MKNVILTSVIIVLIAGLFFIANVKIQAYKAKNKELLSLIQQERTLKSVLAYKRYRGYLDIKMQYTKELVKYAETHKHNRFVMALADKEAAEINYYEAKGGKK